MAIEYVQYDSPQRTYDEHIEAAMNFLNQLVFAEPYDDDEYHEEPAATIFKAIEDGQLIAAAAVLETPHYSGQFLIELMGVIPERRNSGVGGELLRQIEQRVVSLGGCAVRAFPVDERAAGFYGKHGYALADGPDYLVKYLI